MRIFFSINLPEQLKTEILEFAKENIQDKYWRWIKKENLHITVCFLGEIHKEFIKTISESAKQAVVLINSFKIHINKIALAPKNREKRMIWLEINRNPELEKLKNTLERNLLKNNIKFLQQNRPLNLHITLARLKPNSQVLKKELNISFKKEFLVEKIELMKSELRKEGAEYEVVEEFRFEG